MLLKLLGWKNVSLFLFLSFPLCLSVSLSLCLSVFLSFCLSVFLSLCFSVSLSLCLSVTVSLSHTHTEAERDTQTERDTKTERETHKQRETIYPSLSLSFNFFLFFAFNTIDHKRCWFCLIRRSKPKGFFVSLFCYI